MKPAQRTLYNNFIGDPNIFTPASIYRPNDPSFGLQKQIKMLIYAGIETKSIREYVAVSRKNHSRKQFKLGQVKTAVAKKAGSNDIEYEVVYLEVFDPYESTGSTDVKSSVRMKTEEQITVDSVDYEAFDDVTKQGAGVAVFEIVNATGQIIQVLAFGNDLEIITRTGTVIYDANGVITVQLLNGDTVTAQQIATTTSDPFRWRPQGTPIKTDSDAIQISDITNSLSLIHI